MSKRVFLKIAYDGTNYCGWQIQINGITVEEIINRELTNLLGEKIAVIGASRTDSGVHALANAAVLIQKQKSRHRKYPLPLIKDSQRILELENPMRWQQIFILDIAIVQKLMNTKFTIINFLCQQKDCIPTLCICH